MREKVAARGKNTGVRSGPRSLGSGANEINGRPAGGPTTINKNLAGKTSPASANAGMGAPKSTGESLEQSVFRSLEQYFANLDGAKPHALHEMVLGAIEKPLLQFALHRCEGNQSAAADLLGINRNTLRRKLQDYGLH